MTTSRAAARLRESPVSRCTGCGRDTRTVQGVCADVVSHDRPSALVGVAVLGCVAAILLEVLA